jgi:hypothetical protein
MTENCKLRKVILSAFYNILQRNFGIWLILWCSFKLWWNFGLDQNLVYYANGQSWSIAELKPDTAPCVARVRVWLSKYRNDYRVQTTWWKRRSMECGIRSLSKQLIFPRFFFNETPRFRLSAPIHLQCLSQFETLHYPWIPSSFSFFFSFFVCWYSIFSVQLC